MLKRNHGEGNEDPESTIFYTLGGCQLAASETRKRMLKDLEPQSLNKTTKIRVPPLALRTQVWCHFPLPTSMIIPSLDRSSPVRL